MEGKGLFPVPDRLSSSPTDFEVSADVNPAFDAPSVSVASSAAAASSATATAHASRLALSELAPGVMQSEIRAMSTECDRIGGINLAQGGCDTPTPAVVEEAAIAAIRAGYNIYTRLDGIARLRTAIAAKQRRDYGLEYDAEREVLVSSGATGGLHAAAMALLNPGDEVLLFEPFYGYHVATLKSMRVKPVLVALAEPDWTLDGDRSEEH